MAAAADFNAPSVATGHTVELRKTTPGTTPARAVAFDAISLRHGLVTRESKTLQMSVPKGAQVVQSGYAHGFVAGAVTAFDGHHPFSFSPDHLWLMVLQGVAQHVNANSEQLRDRFVTFEGKKTLMIEVPASNVPWDDVINGFATQIADHTVAGTTDLIDPTFSTTAATELVAARVTLMDICQKFFSFKCMTCCGFPSVTLEGALEDWQALRQKSQQLLEEKCLPEFAQSWGTALFPLLDKLVAAYQGEVDETFWNAMVKRGGTSGSGAITWIGGWFNVFFPFLSNGRENRFCQPYSADAEYVKAEHGARSGFRGRSLQTGPEDDDLPSGFGMAPVEWDCLGDKRDLCFKAGLFGATQLENGTVRPMTGWLIEQLPKKQ